MSFSPEKQWLKDEFTHERHGQPPYKILADHPPINGTFDIGRPLFVALRAMKEDAAATIATLSGGEYARFGNRSELEHFS